MNETLFSQIQKLFERTYAQVGINLEDCLINRTRCAQLSMLAGRSACELSELARTFLRRAGDQLYVGIYYSRWLIEQLEQHDPRAGLGDRNIRSLIMFVEELNHALHAALQFKRGTREITSEDFVRNLELQAQVDTYLVLLLFVAFFRKSQRVSASDRRWLRFHLFARQCPDAFRDANLRGRYLETSQLAASYTHYLDTLNGVRRVDEIRRFHSLDYGAKRHRILALTRDAFSGFEFLFSTGRHRQPDFEFRFAGANRHSDRGLRAAKLRDGSRDRSASETDSRCRRRS